ncbi:hypothetical protein SAMN04488048_1612 [Trichococcus flocculiformis]|nr:integrase catalytic core [Trichococcus sp. ES5]SHG28845.1 hypothetical protein SAMN04488048_1612 [Trichococcus flocculiformis]
MLLTLVERQTRFEVIQKLAGKDAPSVNQAVQQLRERAGAHFGQLFKTVTSDNGSEFAGLHHALQDVADVYFSHSYASWERGTSENQVLRIQRWMNGYPRKILGYATPHDTFVQAFRQERLAV